MSLLYEFIYLFGLYLMLTTYKIQVNNVQRVCMLIDVNDTNIYI